jgi:chromosome segregation ATPase
MNLAKGMKPSQPELEAAGDAYAAALQELAPLYAKSGDYFEQEDYKDDKLAWAKEQHPVLTAAWAKFAAANDKLEEEVDDLEDKIQDERLAFLEKSEGKKILYHHTRLLVTAKKLVRRAALIDDPQELDLDGFQKDLEAYEGAWKAVSDYYAAHKQEVDEGARTYWTMEHPAKELLSEAKSLMRRRRDKVRFSTGEKMTINANNAAAVDGHPAAVVQAYNSLISTSNNLF